jgi:hypothetical protein
VHYRKCTFPESRGLETRIGLLSPGVNAFADCFQKASAINVLKLRVEAVSSRIFVDTGILFELSGQHRHVVRRNSL